jgi:AcrR family transcriptional regulator
MRTTPRPPKDAEASVRRSPGRPAVPRDHIIATALRIVDEEGNGVLSMRTLAERLGSGTAVLYFVNRADLIAHVADCVLGEIEINAEVLAAMSWREAYRTVAHALFDAVSRHKNVAPLLVDQVQMGPNAMALRERCIAVLLDNRFPPFQGLRRPLLNDPGEFEILMRELILSFELGRGLCR